MRLFSYVVARDYGFAPNPFYGVCTLATCKPDIRKAAIVGDWVIGTGSKGRQEYLVYAMSVAETLTFNEYWNDPRFQRKRPNLKAGKKQAFGDNIYHQEEDGSWLQENSHHSYPDGTPNSHNVKKDTGKTSKVLIGYEYVYWGGEGPRIPPSIDICKRGPGHRCHFSDQTMEHFINWIRAEAKWGYQGEPLDWPRSA